MSNQNQAIYRHGKTSKQREKESEFEIIIYLIDKDSFIFVCYLSDRK